MTPSAPPWTRSRPSGKTQTYTHVMSRSHRHTGPQEHTHTNNDQVNDQIIHARFCMRAQIHTQIHTNTRIDTTRIKHARASARAQAHKHTHTLTDEHRQRQLPSGQLTQSAPTESHMEHSSAFKHLRRHPPVTYYT